VLQAHVNKHSKKSPYVFIAIGIIGVATALRVLLAALGWPPTNSDEGTMAIAAINIAYHHQTPTIFYGQVYMGVLEAYLGAFFFHLFGGPSLFALRLGVILLVMCFLISTYLLSSLLFSRGLALLTLVVLSIGSMPFFTRQIIATGGSSQTLLFGSLAFLLATWYGLTYRRGPSLRRRLLRLGGYGLFGVVIGAAMWSDMVSLPYLALAVLLLLIFCWRELLLGGVVSALVGFLIGFYPYIHFAEYSGENPIKVLLGLAHGGMSSPMKYTLPNIIHNVHNTITVTIPTATAFPFCPVSELPVLGLPADNTPHSLHCAIERGSWGIGYIVLLGCALIFALMLLRKLYVQSKVGELDFRGRVEDRQVLVKRVAQLCLISAAVLNVLVYTFSSGPNDMPAFHARYLIGLLIATPAVIAPLWYAASSRQWGNGWGHIKAYGTRICLAVIILVLLAGTYLTFSEVPAAQAADQQRIDFIHNLERVGINHFYTEYWTCDSVIFASQGKVICGVINANLQQTHNRAPGYYDTVHADRYASYACRIDASGVQPIYNCLPALENMVAHSKHTQYRRYEFDGYVVYQPIKPASTTAKVQSVLR
jgi:4-amino-4-deoxy-L-arabinose transferase-like glycosyltransferase